jgi:hypothetical protein
MFKNFTMFLETVSLRVPNRNFRDFSLFIETLVCLMLTLVCLMLTLDVTPALPFDAIRRQMPSAVILTCLMKILSRLTMC